MGERWFTSPLNFADEVRRSFRFASRIRLHDVTLRDGEQQAGIVFSTDDKIRIAEKLAEVGVHRIEAASGPSSGAICPRRSSPSRAA